MQPKPAYDMITSLFGLSSVQLRLPFEGPETLTSEEPDSIQTSVGAFPMATLFIALEEESILRVFAQGTIIG
jgi:hypothetical protein